MRPRVTSAMLIHEGFQRMGSGRFAKGMASVHRAVLEMHIRITFALDLYDVKAQPYNAGNASSEYRQNYFCSMHNKTVRTDLGS